MDDATLVGRDELEQEFHKRIRNMLTLAAGNPQPCRRCGRTMWLLPMKKTGKLNPFTEEGISHFADCPGADQERRR